MYLWGRGAGDVVAYQFVLLYQPLSPPHDVIRLSPWRRLVKRLIGQLTSRVCALTGLAVPLSGADGKCAPERNAFI